MLTAAKNQIKVTLLTTKYAVMREMLNKATFLSNVIFMILNNSTFLIQWFLLLSIKESIGGYDIHKILYLWGLASLSYGVAHFFFKGAFHIGEIINEGKLDSYMVQPKNILISVSTASCSPSAMGDIIYGFVLFFVNDPSIVNFLLYTLFGITGGLIVTSVAIILNSLSFWFARTDSIADAGMNLMTTFATYPGTIFKGATKIILYTIVPLGATAYIPIDILTNFDWKYTLIVVGVTVLFVFLAFLIFYRGLKRYASSNLMSARI